LVAHFVQFQEVGVCSGHAYRDRKLSGVFGVFVRRLREGRFTGRGTLEEACC
jgi:hypothetical protein